MPGRAVCPSTSMNPGCALTSDHRMGPATLRVATAIPSPDCGVISPHSLCIHYHVFTKLTSNK